MKKRVCLFVLISFFVVMEGCSRQIVTGQDELGCDRPPGLIAGTAVQIKAFTDILPAFISGGLELTARPELWDTIGIAARGNLTDEYIVCRASKGGLITEEAELEFLRSKLAFMRTTPNTEQFMKWERDHPPPQGNLAVDPPTIHFQSNAHASITLSNFGGMKILYWLENFPDFPAGPFFVSDNDRKGTLVGHGQKTMDVVISMRRGVDLKEKYTFNLRTSIGNGQRFPITIQVNKDQYGR